MKHKEYFHLFVTYCTIFTVATTLFITLFHTPLFGNSIFFYRGIKLLLLATFFSTIILYYVIKGRYFPLFTKRDALLILTLFFTINLTFFITVPVTAERSLTLFLLGYMNNHSQENVTEQQMTNEFQAVFLGENKALPKRFNEQIISGNITKKDDSYELTHQGEIVLQFYEFFTDLFVVDKKNIAP